MKNFTPRLDALPAEQRRFWPELASVPPDFVLYGGTGLALRLGHRQSVDFDFFSSEAFRPDDLEQRLPFFQKVEVAQRKPNTLTFTLFREKPIKVSFFGGLSIGRTGEPELTVDGVAAVASLLDIGATKASVVQVRAEAKDYRDVLALLEAGVSLSDMLGAAGALYPEQFNPLITLKALSYFRDGDLGELTAREQEALTAAVRTIGPIPKINRVSDRLAAR